MGHELRGLMDSAAEAADRLQDDESGGDVEELVELLARVHAGAQSELSRMLEGPARDSLRQACRHLGQARDFVDDGEPPDMAVFEVRAAVKLLEDLVNADN